MSSGKQLLDDLMAQLGLRQINAELQGECEDQGDGQKTKHRKILGLGKSGSQLGVDLVDISQTPEPLRKLNQSPEVSGSSPWITLEQGTTKVGLREIAGANGGRALEYTEKEGDTSVRCTFDRVKLAGGQHTVSVLDFLTKSPQQSAYKNQRDIFRKSGPPLFPEIESRMARYRIADNAAALFLSCRDPFLTNVTQESVKSLNAPKYVLFLFLDPASKQYSQMLMPIDEIPETIDLSTIRHRAKPLDTNSNRTSFQGEVASDSAPIIFQLRAKGTKFNFRIGKKNEGQGESFKQDSSSYCSVVNSDAQVLSKLSPEQTRRLTSISY
jgi:hypothetical protein